MIDVILTRENQFVTEYLKNKYALRKHSHYNLADIVGSHVVLWTIYYENLCKR